MSGLRLRRRLIAGAATYRVMRWVGSAGLVMSLLLAGYQYWLLPTSVGALEFSQRVLAVEGSEPGILSTAAADIDNDGDTDIVAVGSGGVKVYVNEDNDFTHKLVDDTRGERVQVLDMDSDGLKDIFVVTAETPRVRWYRNEGNVEFQGSTIGTDSHGTAYAGDIDGDGTPDIVTATKALNADEVVLRRWINDSFGNFTETVIDSDSEVTTVTVGDLDGNGYQDIVANGENGLQRWDTSDGLTWVKDDLDNDNKEKTHIVVADVNGDGRNDIVTGNQGDNRVVLYRHVEYTRFGRVVLSGEADATTVTVVDLDDDGDEDILAASQDENAVYWFENDGSETFTRETLASNLQSVFGVTAADVDGDNDSDFITGDHQRGSLYWYERVAAKPVATEPSNIKQTSDGAGRVTFDVTFSDGDLDPTRMRVQYSVDGKTWHKPWLLKVTPGAGSVDLKNSNGYQIGTSNAIDTDTNDSVKLTMLWDTKSVENTGGPIIGDSDSVQLRVIPYDGKTLGETVYSSSFRVDNAPPAGLTNLRMTAVGSDAAQLEWDKPTDSSTYTYEIYYGTDLAAVLDRKSDSWGVDDDEAMADIDATSTTITGLSANTTYTFKIFATDSFGNLTAAPSTRGTTLAVTASPGASPVITTSPILDDGTIDTTPTPIPSVSDGFSPAPIITTSPTPLLPASPLIPSPVIVNEPPVADAGVDQVVNASALVILDGTDSTDDDGDSLSFRWRQLSGPSVELLSERTATPSFSAGEEGEAYIFALTVQDEKGGSATDTVTVATKSLVVEASPVPVETGAPPVVEIEDTSTDLALILRPLNWGLFVLSALTTLATLVEQVWRSLRRSSAGGSSLIGEGVPRGRVVHYQTGEPVAGVKVLVYGEDGKLRRTETTTSRGEFPTDFPPGRYTLGVQATGFMFAPAASKAVAPDDGILYSGGALMVEERKPITIVVPLKPTGEGVGSLRTQVLHVWQVVQRLARLLSWPLFVMGALLNTFLIFWMPSAVFLVLEVLYVALVIIKVVLEVRVRPAYGLVRDAITHTPLDLAVVRLYDQKSNRLMMTRVADSQGKFFALPPAGTYRVTVTKPGYAVFSKDSVRITDQQDSVLQMTADLMPVAPSAVLTAPRPVGA